MSVLRPLLSRRGRLALLATALLLIDGPRRRAERQRRSAGKRRQAIHRHDLPDDRHRRGPVASPGVRVTITNCGGTGLPDPRCTACEHHRPRVDPDLRSGRVPADRHPGRPSSSELDRELQLGHGEHHRQRESRLQQASAGPVGGYHVQFDAHDMSHSRTISSSRPRLGDPPTCRARTRSRSRVPSPSLRWPLMSRAWKAETRSRIPRPGRLKRSPATSRATST